MISLSPRCYIASFYVRVYGNHFGHVTNIILIIKFHNLYMYLKQYIQNLVKISSGFLQKQLNFDKIIFINFHFLVPKKERTKFGKIDKNIAKSEQSSHKPGGSHQRPL